ncbi:hypothetical protein B0H14DRAFT_3885536 [Mycena olivaceomarginata]|nr:hypothetical protein B0H14DRAFT_3885536 [Mycena olivaceomarginata]
MVTRISCSIRCCAERHELSSSRARAEPTNATTSTPYEAHDGLPCLRSRDKAGGHVAAPFALPSYLATPASPLPSLPTLSFSPPLFWLANRSLTYELLLLLERTLDPDERSREWRGDVSVVIDSRDARVHEEKLMQTNGELRPPGGGGSRLSKRPGVKTAATSLVYGTLLAPGVVSGAAGLERRAVVGSESAPKIKSPASASVRRPSASSLDNAAAPAPTLFLRVKVSTLQHSPPLPQPRHSVLAGSSRKPHVPPPSPPHTRSLPVLPLIIGFALVLALLSYVPNVLSLRPQFPFLLPPSALILFRPSLHTDAAIFLFFRISLDPPISSRPPPSASASASASASLPPPSVVLDRL